jgi:hypothetical protein
MGVYNNIIIIGCLNRSFDNVAVLFLMNNIAVFTAAIFKPLSSLSDIDRQCEVGNTDHKEKVQFNKKLGRETKKERKG